QHAGAAELALPGLALRPLDLRGVTAKFDLNLALVESGESLAGSLEYATDLFEAVTMRRLLDQLTVLLESAVGELERPVAELPLLRAATRHQLLVEWGGAAERDLPVRSRGLLLHQLFEAQARRTPEAIAVLGERESLTYGELEARA